MIEAPETRYVAIGDTDVAYQVVGDGSPDLLYCWGLGGHLEVAWEYPASAALRSRLASLARLILFDRRGTGMSDGVPRNAIPTWEEWAEDLGAVLDAAGSDQATIVAASDAGPIAILYTAMHPERVRSLVLRDTSSRYVFADDYPVGVPEETPNAIIEMLGTVWGRSEMFSAVYPDIEPDPEEIRWRAKQMRAAATPRTAMAHYRYLLHSLDVRRALPLVQVPTLVVHHSENAIVPLAQGQYLADHIDGATLVEFPGNTRTNFISDSERWFGVVAEFLTGEPPEADIDRVLTTVLFTDIVASTERAASLGDQRWRVVLDAHDRVVRDQLRRFKGREINTTGDGFVVSFEGPARAIRCARAITEATRALGLGLRLGIHTGECEVRGEDLSGVAVHIASRVAALAQSGEILVTGTVKDLVTGSGIQFGDRGLHVLKGVPEEWRLLAVEG
ncbi:MAG: adenylate/guanylate cyclase domain-containing protein [Acidimicrobiales bacterium]